MDIHIHKIVECIKNSSRPSGKIINNIVLTNDIIEKYDTQDVLAICYMIAHNIDKNPVCTECKINKTSFKSTTKGNVYKYTMNLGV